MFNFSNNYNFFRKKYQSAGGGGGRPMTAGFTNTAASAYYTQSSTAKQLLTAYTQSMWVKWTSSVNAGSMEAKMFAYNGRSSIGSSTGEEWSVSLTVNASGKPVFMTNKTDGSELYATGLQKFSKAENTLADHQWHHLCQKREGNVYTGYIDGVQATSVTYGLVGDKNILYKMFIGHSFYYGGSASFVGGFVEPALWDVTLTDEEIASLAAGTDPTTIQTANLIDHYNLTTSETANQGSRSTINLVAGYAPGELPKSTTDVPSISGGGSSAPAAFYANKKVFSFFK